jgi:Bacterial Ig domain
VTAANFVGSAAETSVAHTIVNPPPSCQAVSATTTDGQPVIVALSCSDPAGAALTYAIDNSPAHGALSAFNATTGEVTYMPTSGYSGADSFTYHATSANGTSPVQTVSITVKTPAGGQPAAVAQPPAITNARLTNRRFRVAPQSTAITARKAPLGTDLLIHALGARASADHDHPLGARASQRAPLCRAHRQAQARARQALHAHDHGRDANPRQRSAGSRQPPVQRSHRPPPARPEPVPRGTPSKQPQWSLKAGATDVHDRALKPHPHRQRTTLSTLSLLRANWSAPR